MDLFDMDLWVHPHGDERFSCTRDVQPAGIRTNFFSPPWKKRNMNGRSQPLLFQHNKTMSTKAQQQQKQEEGKELHPTTCRRPMLYLCNSLPVRETKQVIIFKSRLAILINQTNWMQKRPRNKGVKGLFGNMNWLGFVVLLYPNSKKADRVIYLLEVKTEMQMCNVSSGFEAERKRKGWQKHINSLIVIYRKMVLKGTVSK